MLVFEGSVGMWPPSRTPVNIRILTFSSFGDSQKPLMMQFMDMIALG